MLFPFNTDPAVTTDSPGTAPGYFRGLVKILGDVWDATNHGLKLGAAENFVGSIGGKSALATLTFARPADTTSYVLGDLVADSTTAGSVSPFQFPSQSRITGGRFTVTRVRIRKSTNNLTNASFRVHFFSDGPTVDNGDNGAFSSNRAAQWFGSVDVAVNQSFNDGAAGCSDNIAILMKANAGQSGVFMLLEARAAYSPGNTENFTITTEVVQD